MRVVTLSLRSMAALARPGGQRQPAHHSGARDLVFCHEHTATDARRETIGTYRS